MVAPTIEYIIKKRERERMDHADLGVNLLSFTAKNLWDLLQII